MLKIQPLTPEIIEKRRALRRKILGVPHRIWRKTRRGIGWTLAILFVAHCALNIYASVLLNRELAAIRQRGEPLKLSEMAPPAVPDSQNAALVYAQATKSLRFSPAEKTALHTLERSRTPPMLREVEAALLKNQKALDLTRRAASMAGCRFPYDYNTDNPLTLRFPHFVEMRELARFIAAQANVEAKNHDTNAALHDVRALFAMSHHLGEGPTLIGFLVAQSVEAIAYQTLAQVLEQVPLTPVQARAFGNSLPATDWNRVLRDGLLGDRTFSLFVFNGLTSRTLTSQDIISSSDGSPLSFWTSYPLLLLWRPFLKLDEVQSLRLWEKVLLPSSARPFSKDDPKVIDPISQALNEAPRYALMTRILFPIFGRAGQNRDLSEVRGREREIALSLAVCHTSQGKYPARLSEIVALDGKPLPLDPYTQKSFAYGANGKGFLLYSVGVNRADNGGKGQGFGANLNINNDDIVWGNPSRETFQVFNP